MVENNNIVIKNRFVAAVFGNDEPTIRALCDPEFELLQSPDLPYAGLYRGPDGFMQFARKFADTYEIKSFEQTNIYYSDDPGLLIFEFDMQTILRDSGKPFATTILETWRFRNGRVLAVKPYYFNVPHQ